MENPFGEEDDIDQPRRRPEPCHRCRSSNTTVDYGQVDDDDNLPEPVRGGSIPIVCGDCGHSFYGNWETLP